MIAAGCLLVAGCGGDADASDAKAVAQKSTTTSSVSNESVGVPTQFVAADTAADEAPTGNWGTLRGKFVYDGPTFTPDKIVASQNPEVCGKFDLVDQSLVVGEEGQLANVFVSIYVPRGRKLDVHESYDDTAEGEVVLDNKGCSFEPHCLTLRLSQTLAVSNSDPVGHNTNIVGHFNQVIPQDAPLKYQFKQAQIYPLPVACNIHPWMKAHVLVRDDPYAAVSSADGTFEIKNIPSGTHEFAFWHERPGNLGDLTSGKVKTDRRGRMKIEIPAGKVIDLGEIKIPANALEERFGA
jgi:hypothetical protein